MGLPGPTPVPEYIRLIGQGRYSDAYLINWVSNVFPGFWSHLRPALRTRLPPRARGRKQRRSRSRWPFADSSGLRPTTRTKCAAACLRWRSPTASAWPVSAPGPASLTVARDLENSLAGLRGHGI